MEKAIDYIIPRVLKLCLPRHSEELSPFRTSGQDGRKGRYTLPPRTTKRRTTANLKTKKKSELPENQTVWKFNNQEVKEETFIQTGRRSTDPYPGREDSQQHSSWQTW